MPAPKITRKRKRKALPRSNGADRPDPCRPKSWKRSEVSRSSSSLQCNGTQPRPSLERHRSKKLRAEDDRRPVAQISRDSAADGFDVRTSVMTFSLLSTIVENIRFV